MAKTSGSVSVLARHFLWEIVTLKLLPVMLLIEAVRMTWRWIAERRSDA